VGIKSIGILSGSEDESTTRNQKSTSRGSSQKQPRFSQAEIEKQVQLLEKLGARIEIKDENDGLG
jgi:hypothetical protein